MDIQKLTKEQAVIISGFTGILCGEFSDFHADVEKRLGRGVQTFEFGFKEFSAEVKRLYEADFIEMGTVSKEEAKAQAVPEGFVLVKASDRDQEMLELIDQRDYMEDQAEQLKDKLQELYGVDFGEHSSCNLPFQNAIDFDDSDLVLLDKKELRDTYYWDGSEYVVDHPSEYEMELERGEITTLEKWQRTKETNVYCANIYSNEDDFEIVKFESLEEAKKAVAANKAMIEAREPAND